MEALSVATGTRRRIWRPAVATGLVVVLGLAGCGLKGPLTLPSKSEEVTIRGPGQSTTAAPAGSADPAPGGEASTSPGPPQAGVPAATPGSPSEPAPQPAPSSPKRRYDRLPPPALPAGNPGTSRGG